MWKNLKTKKYRDAEGMFLVYGEHLIEKAKQHDAIVEVISTHQHGQNTVLSKDLMDELQQAETYFDDIAVCKKTNPLIE